MRCRPRTRQVSLSRPGVARVGQRGDLQRPGGVGRGASGRRARRGDPPLGQAHRLANPVAGPRRRTHRRQHDRRLFLAQALAAHARCRAALGWERRQRVSFQLVGVTWSARLRVPAQVTTIASASVAATTAKVATRASSPSLIRPCRRPSALRPHGIGAEAQELPASVTKTSSASSSQAAADTTSSPSRSEITGQSCLFTCSGSTRLTVPRAVPRATTASSGTTPRSALLRQAANSATSAPPTRLGCPAVPGSAGRSTTGSRTTRPRGDQSELGPGRGADGGGQGRMRPAAPAGRCRRQGHTGDEAGGVQQHCAGGSPRAPWTAGRLAPASSQAPPAAPCAAGVAWAAATSASSSETVRVSTSSWSRISVSAAIVALSSSRSDSNSRVENLVSRRSGMSRM